MEGQAGLLVPPGGQGAAARAGAAVCVYGASTAVGLTLLFLLAVRRVRAVGVSGGCLEVVWRYLCGIHGNQRRLDVFGGYPASHSLQYGAKTLF